ncbi:zinc-finger-containing protein [Paenibacillus elgii]|uniref:zinc-finger-containing protein n=1 Tax=Paenibacillus elgii TaxID=189691 RepID=UPI002042057E|nr:zinc-finger-containing protein [Paenibacillus elgii]MCM3273768.1 DUF3268 family zinc-finger domain-containing protein [Paenibacillus elgii]
MAIQYLQSVIIAALKWYTHLNAVIYGREYGNGKCYKCTNCDAYVGVHTGTKIPLGRLADRELRDLKKECHALFDPVWKENKNIKREQAYGRLASVLGIPHEECHFGWFDKNMLHKAKVILLKENWYKGINWIQKSKRKFHFKGIKIREDKQGIKLYYPNEDKYLIHSWSYIEEYLKQVKSFYMMRRFITH